ncbi:RepB replication protein, partial (plasmid) [Enterococcus faecalis T2]
SFSIILPYLIVDLKLCNRTVRHIFDQFLLRFSHPHFLFLLPY